MDDRDTRVLSSYPDNIDTRPIEQLVPHHAPVRRFGLALLGRDFPWVNGELGVRSWSLAFGQLAWVDDCYTFDDLGKRQLARYSLGGCCGA